AAVSLTWASSCAMRATAARLFPSRLRAKPSRAVAAAFCRCAARLAAVCAAAPPLRASVSFCCASVKSVIEEIRLGEHLVGVDRHHDRGTEQEIGPARRAYRRAVDDEVVGVLRLFRIA